MKNQHLKLTALAASIQTVTRFGEDDKKYTQAEVDKMVKDKVDAEVSGLKTKNSELIGTQKELKTKITGFEEQIKAFDGIDLEAVKKMTQAAATSKEADMLKNGQFQELMDMKVKAAMEPLQTQLDQTKELLEDEKKARSDSDNKYNVTTTENFIRGESSKVEDIAKSAIGDIVLRGSSVWKNVDGTMKAFEGDTEIMKDGKPIEFGAWIDGMREIHPHYFDKASGAGMTGSQNKGGTDYEAAFKPETRNFTVQAELQKSNPDLYDTYVKQHMPNASTSAE